MNLTITHRTEVHPSSIYIPGATIGNNVKSMAAICTNISKGDGRRGPR